jgi:hypothetical protein
VFVNTKRGSIIYSVFVGKRAAAIEIHHEIQEVYGLNEMTVQCVRKWCQEFSGCRVSVTDEQRSGRPSRIPPSMDRVLRNGFPA